MNLVKKPVITEKSLRAYRDEHKATFEVTLDADKTRASKELETLYGVKVVDAKTSSRLGKTKYSRLSKRFGKLSDKKIMVFKLDQGSNIDLFETK